MKHNAKPGFTTDFFVQNRKKLREYAEDTPIVLTAHGLLQQSSDTTYPFQQDSSFWYLTGINEPDILLVMKPGEEYLIVPGRSTSREAFDGSIDKSELTKTSGIKKIYDEQEGWEKLTQLVRTSEMVATLAAPPPYVDVYGMYTNPARRRLTKRLEKLNAKMDFGDLREALAGMRMIKQEPELEAIRSAIKVTIDALYIATLPANLKNYKHEYEIEADLSRAFRRTGASGHAFAPIVASGPRGCTLHNVQNNGKIQPGELVVMDVGAAVDHYAADITRTVVATNPTDRQQAVYDAVKDVQVFALKLLKPGTLLKEYEAQVELYMGEKLVALGLIKEIDHASVRKYYPHSTTHFLGLDVHDVGDYTRPLEPGMVMTCEPGIYIPEESIGIRIEDDILITEKGHEILSSGLPAQLYANA